MQLKHLKIWLLNKKVGVENWAKHRRLRIQQLLQQLQRYQVV